MEGGPGSGIVAVAMMEEEGVDLLATSELSTR